MPFILMSLMHILHIFIHSFANLLPNSPYLKGFLPKKPYLWPHYKRRIGDTSASYPVEKCLEYKKAAKRGDP